MSRPLTSGPPAASWPLALGLATLALVLAAPRPATAAFLSDLLAADATLDAGGLRFSQFEILDNSTQNGASIPDPATITVVPRVDGAFAGLSFTAPPGTLAASGPDAFASLVIRFDVAAIDGLSTFANNRLVLGGTAFLSGSADLTETFYTGQATGDQNSTYLDGTFGNRPESLFTLSAPFSELIVDTSVYLQAPGADGSTSVGSFATYFDIGSVPGPTSGLLTMLGLAGLLGARGLSRLSSRRRDAP